MREAPGGGGGAWSASTGLHTMKPAAGCISWTAFPARFIHPWLTVYTLLITVSSFPGPVFHCFPPAFRADWCCRPLDKHAGVWLYWDSSLTGFQVALRSGGQWLTESPGVMDTEAESWWWCSTTAGWRRSKVSFRGGLGVGGVFRVVALRSLEMC